MAKKCQEGIREVQKNHKNDKIGLNLSNEAAENV